ncbi:MAG: K(+)-stimulated pyrophosphate-energized sodium pump, partial [Methanolobus sp.]|nr:K(+)-stimulated pyrophosphate-energized sodium pump [Methanolobus sp.]
MVSQKWQVCHPAYVRYYTGKVGLTGADLSLTKPVVLVGLFIGGLLPFVFSAVTMQAVGKAAFKIVNEV